MNNYLIPVLISRYPGPNVLPCWPRGRHSCLPLHHHRCCMCMHVVGRLINVVCWSMETEYCIKYVAISTTGSPFCSSGTRVMTSVLTSLPHDVIMVDHTNCYWHTSFVVWLQVSALSWHSFQGTKRNPKRGTPRNPGEPSGPSGTPPCSTL